MSEPLRVCRVCGLEAWTDKELEPFREDKRKLYGRDAICKTCSNKQHREWREYRKHNPIPPKPLYLRKCRDCGLEAWSPEDLEKFVKSNVCPHQRENRCKKCRNKYNRKYYRKNPLKGRYGSMMTRCYNKNRPEYPRYGGRGIIVCGEWRNDRQAFIDWAETSGFKPELTIDRIDNEGPYAPWNCRWVDRKTQQRNRERNTTNWEKGTRICPVCGLEKPFSEYHRNRTRGKHERKYFCKQCVNEKNRQKRKNKP